MFDEGALLAQALRKWGGSRGFHRRRLEADRLHAELSEQVAHDASTDDDEGGGGEGPTPLSLAARLARARRADVAAEAEGGIAWTAGALVDTREAARYWTLPAALAGFNLRLADVVAGRVPQRRHEPPHRLAFDFGVLLRERELVALARRYHGPNYSKVRRRARRREALVEEARRRVVEEEEEEEEGGEGEREAGKEVVGTRARDVVASLLCPLAHYRADDPGAAKRSLSSITDLLGLKWCVRVCVCLLHLINLFICLYERSVRRSVPPTDHTNNQQGDPAHGPGALRPHARRSVRPSVCACLSARGQQSDCFFQKKRTRNPSTNQSSLH